MRAAAGLLALALLIAVRGTCDLDRHRAGRGDTDEIPARWSCCRRSVGRATGGCRLRFVATLVVCYLPYISVGWRGARFPRRTTSPRKALPAATVSFCWSCWDRSCHCRDGRLALTSLLWWACLACLAARFAFTTELARGARSRARVMQARQAAILGAVLLVALSPHYPWYLGWLAPLACLAPLAECALDAGRRTIARASARSSISRCPGAVYRAGRDPALAVDLAVACQRHRKPYGAH